MMCLLILDLHLCHDSKQSHGCADEHAIELGCVTSNLSLICAAE